jgi:hypothetical protein
VAVRTQTDATDLLALENGVLGAEGFLNRGDIVRHLLDRRETYLAEDVYDGGVVQAAVDPSHFALLTGKS